MLRTPSRKIRKHNVEKPNLIPILDSVFIFIFFLLMSANFIKIFEIGSDVPLVSDSPPPPNNLKPLALTVKITESRLEIYTGIPATLVKTVASNGPGSYDLYALHTFLVSLKKKNMREKTVILEPEIDIEYDKLVRIMDSVRLLDKTDEALYTKDKSGIDVKETDLFSNIIFGNIKS